MDNKERVGFRQRFELFQKWCRADVRQVPDEILHHSLLCYIRNGGAVETHTFRRHVALLSSLSPMISVPGTENVTSISPTTSSPRGKGGEAIVQNEDGLSFLSSSSPSSSSSSAPPSFFSTHSVSNHWDRLPLSLLDLILTCLRTDEKLGRAQPVNRVWRSRVLTRHAWRTLEWPTTQPSDPSSPQRLATLFYFPHDTPMQRLFSLRIALPPDVTRTLERLEVRFTSVDDRFCEMVEWLLQAEDTSSSVFVRLRTLVVESKRVTVYPPLGLQCKRWWKVMPVLESLTLLVVDECDLSDSSRVKSLPPTLTTLRTCGCSKHRWLYPSALVHLTLYRIDAPIDLHTLHALQHAELEIIEYDDDQTILSTLLESMSMLPHLHTVQCSTRYIFHLLDTTVASGEDRTERCRKRMVGESLSHYYQEQERQRNEEAKQRNEEAKQRMVQRSLSLPSPTYHVYLPRPPPPPPPPHLFSFPPPPLDTLCTQSVEVLFSWWKYFQGTDHRENDIYIDSLYQQCRKQLALRSTFMIFLPAFYGHHHVCPPPLSLPQPAVDMLHCAHMRIAFAPLMKLVEKGCRVTLSKPLAPHKRTALHPCPCSAPTADL